MIGSNEMEMTDETSFSNNAVPQTVGAYLPQKREPAELSAAPDNVNPAEGVGEIYSAEDRKRVADSYGKSWENMSWFDRQRAMRCDSWYRDLKSGVIDEETVADGLLNDPEIRRIDDMEKKFVTVLKDTMSKDLTSMSDEEAQGRYMAIVEADPRFGFKDDTDGSKMFGAEAEYGRGNLKRLMSVYSGVNPNGLYSREAQRWMESPEAQRIAAAKEKRGYFEAAKNLIFDTDEEVEREQFEKLLAQNRAVQFSGLMAGLSPAAQEIVRQSLAKGEIDRRTIRFLDEDERDVALRAYQVGNPELDANWWLTQGLAQFGETTASMVRGTWMMLKNFGVGVANSAAGTFAELDRYEREQAMELQIRDAEKWKYKDNLTFGGKMLSGLIGSAPYMAAMTNPLTGTAATLGMANDCYERAVAAGADPSLAMAIALPAGVAIQAIEKLQWNGIFGKDVSEFAIRRMAISKIIERVTKDPIRVTARRAGAATVEALKTTATEDAEEVLQQLTEDVGVSLSTGDFNVKEIVSECVDTAVESFPTTLGFGLLRVSGIGPAIHRKFSRQSVGQSDFNEYVQGKNFALNALTDKDGGKYLMGKPAGTPVITADLSEKPQGEGGQEGNEAQNPQNAQEAQQEQKQGEQKKDGEKQDKGPETDALKEKLLDDMRTKWKRSKSSDRINTLVNCGLDADHAAIVDEFFRMEEDFFEDNPYFTYTTNGGEVNVFNIESLPNVMKGVEKVEVNEDGSHTLHLRLDEQTVVPVKVERVDRSSLKTGANAEQFERQVAQNYEKQHGEGTWAELDEDAKNVYRGLSTPGGFTHVTVGDTTIPYSAIVQLAKPDVAKGDAGAELWEVGHEIFHAATLIAEKMGVLTPEDIAKMRKVFGEPKSEGYRFDEEGAADAYGRFLVGKADDATGVFAKIRDLFTRIWNALNRKSGNEPAELNPEEIFKAIRRGNLRGISELVERERAIPEAERPADAADDPEARAYADAVAREDASNGDIRQRFSISTEWPDDFPDATAQTTRAYINGHYAELFKRAKAGDVEAAEELVEKVCKVDKIRQLGKDHPNARIVAPVIAQEATGHNQIPRIFAKYVASILGIETDTSIVQTVRANHTGSAAEHRLFVNPEFDGEVVRGAEYIVVDDHITQGGTVNSLRDHIERNGGKVVAVAALTLSQGSSKLSPRKGTLDELYAKWPDIDNLLRIGGIAESAGALTQSQAKYILKFSPDTFRDRAIAQGNEGSGRTRSEALGASASAEVGERRGSVTFNGRDTADVVAGLVAVKARRGEKMTVNQVQKLLAQVGADTSLAGDILHRGQKAAGSVGEKLRGAAVDDSTFMELATDDAKKSRLLDFAEHIGEKGYELGAEDERKVMELNAAKSAAVTAAIANAQGFAASQMENKYGFNLVESVANANRPQVNRAPGASKVSAEDGPGEVNGPGITLTEMNAADEAAKAKRDAANAEVAAPESAAMVDIRAKAARRADKIDEKFKLDGGKSPMQKSSEQVNAGGAADGGEGGEGGSGGETAAQDRRKVKRDKLDFLRASDFLGFVEELVARETGKPDLFKKGKDGYNGTPADVRTLIKTAQFFLRKVATRLTYSRGREFIMRDIEDMTNATTLRGAEAAIMNMYSRVQDRLIPETQDQLIKRLEYMGRQLAEKGPFMSRGGDERERKVRALVEEWWRNVKRYLRLSPDMIEHEKERLREIIENRENAYPEDAGKSKEEIALAQDLRYRTAVDLMNALTQYGGLINRTPGEIADRANEIIQQLKSSRAELENRREDEKIRARMVAETLRRAVVNPNAQKNRKRPTPGWVTRLFDSMMGILELRLRDLIRYSYGEVRTRAEESIQGIEDALSVASQTYNVYKVNNQRDFTDMLKRIYGSSEDGMRRLSESLPEDVRKVLVKQGTPDISRAWLLQRYVELCQTDDYARNIAANGRDGRWREAFDKVFKQFIDERDMAFLTWMRDWYRGNLRELNAKVLVPVSGIEQYSPGENYFPVKMLLPTRQGVDAKAKAWSPLPSWLTPRITNDYDFDEKTDIISMWFKRMDESGRSIAYAKAGLGLSDILLSPGLKDAVRDNHGDVAFRRLVEHVTDIISGGGKEIVNSDDSLAFADRLRAWQTNLTLSCNLVSAFKQMLSCPVYALRHDIDFGMVARFMTHVDMASVKELMASDGWKARYGSGFNEAISNAMRVNSERGGTVSTFLKTLYNSGFSVMEVGDSVPCLWVGQGLYRYFLARIRDQEGGAAKMTDDEIRQKALARTWAIIEMTQQSKRTENLTAAQRGGPMGRFLYQFVSSPVQQLAFEVQAVREALAARGTPHAKEANLHLGRVLVVNHVLMPNMMTIAAVSAGLALGRVPDRDDEIWDMLINTIMGQFGCIFLAGAVGETTLHALLTGKFDYREHGLPVNGIIDLFQQLGITAHDVLMWNNDAFLKDMIGTMKSISAPTRHAAQAIENWGMKKGENKRNKAIRSWTR